MMYIPLTAVHFGYNFIDDESINFPYYLNNTEITLYTDAACTNIAKDINNNNCVGTVQNGTLVFNVIDQSDENIYYAKCTRAPFGYRLETFMRVVQCHPVKNILFYFPLFQGSYDTIIKIPPKTGGFYVYGKGSQIGTGRESYDADGLYCGEVRSWKYVNANGQPTFADGTRPLARHYRPYPDQHPDLYTWEPLEDYNIYYIKDEVRYPFRPTASMVPLFDFIN